MPEPARWRALWPAVLELLLLVLPAAGFLHLYAQHPAGSAAAVGPHLQVLGSVWLLLLALRLVAWTLAPGPGPVRLLVSALVVSVLLAWLAYAVLVLVGMWSWGRVVSSALVRTYAGQAPQLAQAVGLPFWPLLGGLVAGWLLLVLSAWRWWAPRDWVRRCVGHLPRRWRVLLPALLLTTVALKVWTYVQLPPVPQREPLALTLFAEQAGFKIQNQTVQVSALLAEAAEADRRQYRPAPPGPRPNVVLIVADALRADRIGLMGYERPTTPHIDTLARNGHLRLATSVRTACAESACGLLALTRSKPVHQLTDGDVTLHEVLKRHGYGVNLVLGGDHTNFYGLRDAFGRVDSFFDGSMAPLSRGANDDRALLDQLDRLAPFSGQPLMLHMHLMASHTLGTRLPQAQRFQPAAPYMTWLSKQNALFDKADPQATNHYDNGVVGADLIVHETLQRLQRLGYLRDAVVVITGDHGEMLGEHGEFGHAKGVYEPALKVPFILLRFGAGAVQPVTPGLALASQLDIAPTLLHEIGLPRPASWMGLSLLSPQTRRFLPFSQGHQTGVYDSRDPDAVLKYWKHQRSGQEFAFDLKADPAEQNNLVSRLPQAHLMELRKAVLDQVAGLVQ